MSLGEDSEAANVEAQLEHAEPEQRSFDPLVTVGEYTWDDFIAEFGTDARDDQSFVRPDDVHEQLDTAISKADRITRAVPSERDPAQIPGIPGVWTWHDQVRAFHDPEYVGLALPDDFDPAADLGHSPAVLPDLFAGGQRAAHHLESVIEDRTVNVSPGVDEDSFFSQVDGTSTIVSRYDLEKAVPLEKKAHFREVDRYWVNKPFSFVVIFHSEKENETKYYLIEPHLTAIEEDLLEFLSRKLRTSIKYSDDVVIEGGEENRRAVIERETLALLERYDIYRDTSAQSPSITDRIRSLLGQEVDSPETEPKADLDGAMVRPEPALLDEDPATLTEFQVEKLLYRLKRDFIGYERIDGVKHDINVEDISCDGYNSPVFVYHTDYEQIISNIFHGESSLDDFVVKLAQRSGKGISKRQPQVDATLPDGSRAQLTLGREVSDHGTNYTIRQFKDVPFTPIDLINWRTFSLEEMAFLWLCIENHKSLIFAGGTASGKTTSLNAVSLFIPSNTKIVSIEDTREVELPQRNWIASVTRPSFSEDSKGDVDEFDLLEAALRQRPDYIVMGEIRGEEGRTLFQVMSTGHTTYTTFHADSVGEVLKRFTTAPINVSKTMFTALDLVSIQTSTRVRGQKVRRNKSLTEINHYDPENDEINVRDVYQWRAETDEFMQMSDANTFEEILFDRGWDRARLDEELFKREVVLAYLIQNGLSEYRQVAATLQAFIADPETTFSLIASDDLESSLADLREMESVLIDVDPEKEAMVPRPDPDEELLEETTEIIERASEELFPEYQEETNEGIVEALATAAAPESSPQPNEPGTADLSELRAAIEEAGGEFDIPAEQELAEFEAESTDDPFGDSGEADELPSEDDEPANEFSEVTWSEPPSENDTDSDDAPSQFDADSSRVESPFELDPTKQPDEEYEFIEPNDAFETSPVEEDVDVDGSPEDDPEAERGDESTVIEQKDELQDGDENSA